MPSKHRKPKPKPAPSTLAAAPPPSPPSPSSPPHPAPPPFPPLLPLLSHTLLTLLPPLLLPRTPFLLLPLPPPPSSLDHPQPTWLAPLTASPLSTLAWTCVGLVPVLAQWARRVPSATGSLRNALVSIPLAAIPLFLLLLLLGAPLTSHLPHTALLATLLALLTAFVPSYVLPPPAQGSSLSAFAARHTWLRIFCEWSPQTPIERLLLYPSLLSLAGSWLGAPPIALDWDRPWQAWPLTPAYGAVFGYIAGIWVAWGTNLVCSVYAGKEKSA